MTGHVVLKYSKDLHNNIIIEGLIEGDITSGRPRVSRI